MRNEGVFILSVSILDDSVLRFSAPSSISLSPPSFTSINPYLPLRRCITASHSSPVLSRKWNTWPSSASAYTRRSLTHNVSKNSPIVLRSCSKSSGPSPREAVPIDGSMKYLVLAVRMADFDRRLGFHASESSMTNILRNASIYELMVF